MPPPSPAKIKGGEVYFIHGSEESLIKAEIARLKKEVLSEAPDPSTAWTLYDLAEGAGQLLADVMTVSFFGGLRGVLASNAEKLGEEDQPALLRYVESPSPDVVLVLRAGKVDGRLKFWKDFSAKAKTFKFDPKDGERRAIVAQKMRSRKISFSRAAEEMFLERFQNRLSFADAELDKLETYLGGAKTVEVADVEACVSTPPLHSVFKLVDMIGHKKTEASLETLKTLKDDGEEPIMLMGMIARQFRILLRINTLKAQRLNDAEIAAKCGLNSYYASGYFAQASKLSAETLKKNIVRLSQADLRIKSSGLNEWHVMEQEIISLTAT
ncbi:MAG: DNA polymerase III subunit delta [Nitrospinae bacterium]|nr:DNA polymerase III subunit delta [Nitrospinota bacterium]